ncbi:hypothetical protein MVEN_01124100 [Mycena venus]|uniref:Uncharacterized protein n=1 Tax=Mycena venus TaxID=2733690 RepID=A0A8H7CXX8_9AGAR|nr:hypothetical protein MVEN_01124100 [Mycena venus]
MRTEGDLIRLALDDVIYGTLEADWAAMDMFRKEELALEGLYQAACVAPRLGHNSRLSCPEMTIGHLAGDGEYNFLRMLKRLIDHDSTGNARVKSVFFFTHPYFEHDNRRSDAAPDILKAVLYWNSLLRTLYIVNTLLGILYAYVYSFVYLFVYPINSLIECQKKDWPSHRKFCDQERFDPALLTPTPEADDSFIGCPTTVEGFSRPLALWCQIRSLSHNDSLLQDYHFYETSGSTLSLRIFDPPGAQMVFLVARRCAMASGSPAAVHMMFTIVKHQWQHVTCNPDITLEQIRSQLEKEYRVKVTDMGVEGTGAFVPPTRKELEEQGYLEQRLSMADPAVHEDYRRLQQMVAEERVLGRM